MINFILLEIGGFFLILIAKKYSIGRFFNKIYQISVKCLNLIYQAVSFPVQPSLPLSLHIIRWYDPVNVCAPRGLLSFLWWMFLVCRSIRKLTEVQCLHPFNHNKNNNDTVRAENGCFQMAKSLWRKCLCCWELSSNIKKQLCKRLEAKLSCTFKSFWNNLRFWLIIVVSRGSKLFTKVRITLL